MPHLLDKSWILYSTSQKHPFYISDNPVTLFNVNQDPVKGTLGLRVPGIEIHRPLTGTFCLGVICPTIEATIRESYELARRLGHPVPLRVIGAREVLRLAFHSAGAFRFRSRSRQATNATSSSTSRLA
jgi:hypothetical protein